MHRQPAPAPSAARLVVAFSVMEHVVRMVTYAAVIAVNIGYAVLGWSAVKYQWLPDAYRVIGSRVHAAGLSAVVVAVTIAFVLSWRHQLYSNQPGRPLFRRSWVAWTFALGTFLWFSTAVWSFITPGNWAVGFNYGFIAIGIALGHAGCWRAARYQTAWVDAERERRGGGRS